MNSNYTQIKGLSERRRLPRLGKIRLGVKVQTNSGKEYPKEASYFVCPPEVQKVYGEKPIELDIMFPVEDTGACFPQALKWYGSAQNLKCKGDGETALRGFEYCTDEQKEGKSSGDMVEVSCPCENLDNGCSARGCLMVLLPNVSIGGVYQIDTGSGANIITINSYLDYLKELTQGRTALIPLKLRRIEQNMTYKDKEGKTKKSMHYLLRIELALTLADISVLRANSQMILPSANYLLPAPVEDGRDFPEVIVQEQEVLDKEIPEPQKKKAEPVEKEQAQKHIVTVEEVGNLLLGLAGGSKEAAASLLEVITSFTDKNGKAVCGRKTLKGISDIQLKVVYGKAKDLKAERERQAEEMLSNPIPQQWKDVPEDLLKQAVINLGWTDKHYLQIAVSPEDEEVLMAEVNKLYEASM